ncbi:hypothetical protein HY310_01575 [Candidatus Microgenomates bacterium]|nr:hypothetical protein [Candidatus Microgenomates bacterium]
MAIAANSLAPWIPIRNFDLERLFKVINLKPGEVFYELGSGDGRVCLYAGKHYKNMIIGLELAIPMFLISKFRNKYKNVVFKNANIFSTNLTEANVVYVYGLPRVISSRLKAKLEKDLKPGSRVISYAFIIDGWKPVKIQKEQDKLPIFVYEIS